MLDEVKTILVEQLASPPFSQKNKKEKRERVKKEIARHTDRSIDQ